MALELETKLAELVSKELTPEEELDRAWGIFMKLPKEDRFVLMLYLCKHSPAVCQMDFFTRFAHDFKGLRL